jgi:hypothetical protein
MAYIPDFCSYELTPGQMARMIAQVKAEKDYIYCNYASVLDAAKCAGVVCASTATSPNCAAQTCDTASDCSGATTCTPKVCISNECVDGADPCLGQTCITNPICGLTCIVCDNNQVVGTLLSRRLAWLFNCLFL